MPSVSIPARLRTSVALSLLLCVVACPAAHGLGFHGDRPYDKREIVRLEYQLRAAQISGDASAMDRLLAEDYVGINMTGQVNTKAQFLNRVRSHDLTLSRIDLRNIRVKFVGDVAIVRVLAEVQGTSRGTPLLGSFRYTRIYHRLPSGLWKVTHFEATRMPGHTQELRRVSDPGADES